MPFTLLPAVDVSNGRVARAAAGDTDPLSVALAFQAAGAEWIHLVDLDAAYGRGTNTELLTSIVGELDIPVELAGGIRDDESLDRVLATGCSRVNLASPPMSDPVWCARVVAEHGDRIAVCLDVEPTGHRLAPRGSDTAGGDLWETMAHLDEAGCSRYIVTDVSRDGRMTGPNLDLVAAVAAATPAKVISSGGIGSIDDLRTLASAAVEHANIEGSVLGAALLAGRFALGEALAAVGSTG